MQMNYFTKIKDGLPSRNGLLCLHGFTIVSFIVIMRCSRYGNVDRMHVILNGEPLEEVDCFKYLG